MIDITSISQLSALRYDLDGDGEDPFVVSEYNKAFPYPMEGMGCRSACVGYEIINNLTFDTNGDGEITEADEYWNAGVGGSQLDPLIIHSLPPLMGTAIQ